jgi:hypothetical protein
MPALAALVFGLQLLCLAHVVRTGRACQWFFIIMALPLASCLVYFFVESCPTSVAAAPPARQCVTSARPSTRSATCALTQRAAEADTVENRTALAEECLRRGRSTDAKRLFQSCLTGPHATDHTLMLGLAQAQFALEDYAGACETLDRLRAAHPDLSCPEGHLIYARSKEQQGQVEQALIEYAALVGYYPGEEARCRLALLLQKTGRVAEARALFEDVVRSVERASRIYRRTERDWYEVARRNLTG